MNKKEQFEQVLKYTLRNRRGTVYLSGKISPGAKSTYYRGRVTKKFRDAGFHTLDPMRGKIKKSSKWTDLNPPELVHRDLNDIIRSSVVLSVIMKDGRKQSFGTPCEIMFAYTQHVPAVLVTNDKTLANHPWVRHLCCRVFSDVDAAVDYIIDYFGTAEDEDQIIEN